MSIKQTICFFESLNTENSTKSEKRLYKKYISLLNDLKSRDFSKTEIQTIEKELTNLRLESDSSRKELNKKLNSFSAFLKKEFSLVPEGVNTGLGMALGMCFGMIIGSYISLTLGTSFGMIIGLCIGMIIGSAKDAELKKQGKVLSFKSAESIF